MLDRQVSWLPDHPLQSLPGPETPLDPHGPVAFSASFPVTVAGAAPEFNRFPLAVLVEHGLSVYSIASREEESTIK